MKWDDFSDVNCIYYIYYHDIPGRELAPMQPWPVFAPYRISDRIPDYDR